MKFSDVKVGGVHCPISYIPLPFIQGTFMNKSETKFRIGDHVVVVRDEQFPQLAGVTGTVLDSSSIPYVRFDDKSRYPRENMKRRDQLCFDEKDLELSHIHNSPLYKALS